MAEKISEQFLADMVGICSRFFKEMHETCEKYKTKQPTKKKGKSNENSTENGEKRTKKPKDPNAPKRPTSNVYMIYFNERRPHLLQERPELKSDPKGLARIAGEEWKSLPQDTKMLYYAKSAKIKESYGLDATAENAKSKIRSESEEKKEPAKPIAKSANLKPKEPVEATQSQKLNFDVSENESDDDDDDDDNDDDSMVSESSEASKKKETPKRRALESSDGESDVEQPTVNKKVKKN